jgi:hypothetical protein
LNSMVRIALVESRSRIEPTLSDNSEIVCKFGRKRRFVLRFEWLTLLPTWTPLPVTGHLRAMPFLASAPKTENAIVYAITGARVLSEAGRRVKTGGALRLGFQAGDKFNRRSATDKTLKSRDGER